MWVCCRCQPEGGGHGGQSDDGDQPASSHAEKRQTKELQPQRSHAGRDRLGSELGFISCTYKYIHVYKKLVIWGIAGFSPAAKFNGVKVNGVKLLNRVLGLFN